MKVNKEKLEDNDPGEWRIPFGAHKGKKLKELPDDYLYFLYQGTPYGKIKEYLDKNIDAIIANLNKGKWFNKYEK